MSWKDQLQPGTFRGVPFHTESHDTTGGRRLAVHQYPFRDKPYAEDLGRKGRELNVDAYVIGADYMAARDRLIEALEAAGPGLLIHPYLGSQRVAVQSYRLRETTREGGMATISITFVEAGELTYPAAGIDTAQAVDAAADAALSESIDDFAGSFSIDGMPDAFLAETEAELARSLSDLESSIGSVNDTIAAEIRAPYNMATLITGSIATISALADKPKQALKLYEGLFNTGDDSPSVPTDTAIRKQQARSHQALHNLIQRTAVIEAGRSSSQASYPSRSDALNVADSLNDTIDDQMARVDAVTGAPITDAMYQALVQLRTTINRDLRERGARLPELTTYTPAVTLPSLVIAHRLYGDASRGAEIVDRNNIRHPGFVAGGQELEVLNG